MASSVELADKVTAAVRSRQLLAGYSSAPNYGVAHHAVPRQHYIERCSAVPLPLNFQAELGWGHCLASQSRVAVQCVKGLLAAVVGSVLVRPGGTGNVVAVAGVALLVSRDPAVAAPREREDDRGSYGGEDCVEGGGAYHESVVGGFAAHVPLDCDQNGVPAWCGIVVVADDVGTGVDVGDVVVAFHADGGGGDDGDVAMLSLEAFVCGHVALVPKRCSDRADEYRADNTEDNT